MMFGKDFFKILKFAMQILVMFAKIFGDDEDNDNANNDLGDAKDPNTLNVE